MSVELNRMQDAPEDSQEEWGIIENKTSINYVFWRLSESQTSEEFYYYLREAIFIANLMTDEERAALGNIASKPWKGTPGRPQNAERQRDIYFSFVHVDHDPEGDTAGAVAPIPRTHAINQIAERYGISHEAAAKAYDTAKRDGPYPATRAPRKK